MVEVAKEILHRMFDQAERDMKTNRLPVKMVMECAVTNTGTRIPKSALKQARKELGIDCYQLNGIWYWERGGQA